MDDLFPVLISFGEALAVTVFIEECIAYFFFRNKCGVYTAVLLANIVTNPAVNLIYSILKSYFKILPYGFIVMGMEIIVIWIEWRLISYTLNHKSKRYFIYSLTANAVSYAAGLLIFA